LRRQLGYRTDGTGTLEKTFCTNNNSGRQSSGSRPKWHQHGIILEQIKEKQQMTTLPMWRKQGTEEAPLLSCPSILLCYVRSGAWRAGRDLVYCTPTLRAFPFVLIVTFGAIINCSCPCGTDSCIVDLAWLLFCSPRLHISALPSKSRILSKPKPYRTTPLGLFPSNGTAQASRDETRRAELHDGAITACPRDMQAVRSRENALIMTAPQRMRTPSSGSGMMARW